MFYSVFNEINDILTILNHEVLPLIMIEHEDSVCLDSCILRSLINGQKLKILGSNNEKVDRIHDYTYFVSFRLKFKCVINFRFSADRTQVECSELHNLYS